MDELATHKPENRRTVIIGKDELKSWKAFFKLFGTKSEFERTTGRSSVGLDKILKRGRGGITMVSAIRDYIASTAEVDKVEPTKLAS